MTPSQQRWALVGAVMLCAAFLMGALAGCDDVGGQPREIYVSADVVEFEPSTSGPSIEFMAFVVWGCVVGSSVLGVALDALRRRAIRRERAEWYRARGWLP